MDSRNLHGRGRKGGPSIAGQISGGRKAAYYGGMALIAVGFVLFLSAIPVMMSGGTSFARAQSSMGTAAFLSFGGIAVIIVGNLIRGAGARGLAGSGLKLDPEQARKDLEPYSKMAGGMVQDAVSQVKAAPFLAKSEPQVRVRCPACKALNEELAKYCSQCGKAMA